MVVKAGGVAGRLAIARDTLEDVRERVAEGRAWDLMILSGGVSMGEYDLVEEVLAEAGAEFLFTGVLMQPGKPVVFGRFPDGKYFFGLPGNPVSTQVTFHCFVEPFLKALGGGVVEGPLFLQAALGEAVGGSKGRMRFLPARLTRDRIQPSVEVVAWQGSGDMAANARANCYAVLPQREGEFPAGEVISVLLR
jgi:molybdopterin molybdotransferase